MIKSMTGYGRGQSQRDNLSFTVEIKAVNHRYADINIKAPRLVTPFESQIKKQVGEFLKRGKIDIYITQNNNSQATVRPVVNKNLAAAYLEALQDIRDLKGVVGEVPLEYLASLPDVVRLDDVSVVEEEILSCLETAVAEALDVIVSMRCAEGAATAVDMTERLGLLREMLTGIESQAATVPLEWQRKLTERLTRLQNGAEMDPQRVAQEVAVFADRCDISEELVRFRSHLDQFSELISHAEPVGRQLDFLVQELNREANTMGSKSNDATLTRYVVGLKSELEKIREQVQNIE
jgi:uncharacterized protein (TIGR00255 family)